MKAARSALLTGSLLALATCASAQLATNCPATDVCFKLNIPEKTASSGTGDIFFQISAPSSYEWVALGQGRGMSGANIFVVYTAGRGSNVTLSPRQTNGHTMPTHNDDVEVQLLEGSGVSDGIMTANVKCSNCDSWSGGSMDFTSGSGNWIYGFQTSGGPKNSNDKSANINMHSRKAAFSWDFTNAKGGSSVNPLIVSAAASASQSAGASPTGTSDVQYTDDGESGGSSTMVVAHGVLASLAFVLLFPAGAIAIRLARFPGIVWIHAAFQVFAFVIYVAAFGLGVHLANQLNLLNNAYHPKIGITVFVLLVFQPVLGMLHHIFFKKRGKRTVWSHAHIWLGRVAVTLGIINGGFGLSLARSSRSAKIAYGVIAAIIWLVWVAAIAVGEKRRARASAGSAPDSPMSKNSDSRPSASSGPAGTELTPVEAIHPPTAQR